MAVCKSCSAQLNKQNIPYTIAPKLFENAIAMPELDILRVGLSGRFLNNLRPGIAKTGHKSWDA